MEIKELKSIIEQNRGKTRAYRFLDNTSLKILARLISDPEKAKSITASGLLKLDNLPFSETYITDFLKELISNHKIRKVLDPWANIGQFLNILDLPAESKKGYVISNELLQLNEALGTKANLIYGDPQDLIEKESETFHLIISNLPIGLSTRHKKFGLARNDLSFQLILQCLSRLKEDGILISSISGTLFSSSNGKKFIDKVNELGYRIKAIFETPASALNNLSRVSFFLVVIEKGEQDEVFISEILDDPEQQTETLKNFRSHKSDRNLSYGTWKKLPEINSLSKLKLFKEVDILIKRTGITPSALSVLGEFVKPQDISTEDIVVQIPTFLSAKVRMAETDKELKENAYHFLKLDINKANPYYLINFLNSELGKKIFSKYASGVTIPSINKSVVPDIELPIPGVEIQNETVSLDKKIKDLKDYFSSQADLLWKNPKSLLEVQNNLDKKIKKSDNIEWLEELPFPLASIYWGYLSETDTSKKVEYLLLFFEGFCEFLDTLIISAISSDKSFYQNTAKEWLTNEKEKLWHEKATFGNWQNLYAVLRKNITKLLTSKQKGDKEVIENLFANANANFFDLITSKDLNRIFDQVVTIRNSYKGHGGITSEARNKEVLLQLEEKFDSIKDVIIRAFRNINLFTVVPKTMDWDEGENLFETTCKILKGTRSKFKQEEIKTSRRLSSGKLYLLPENQFRPIELLPFVQMREAPRTQQNACYFYNRIEGDKVRLVSYHYDKEEELFIERENMASFIQLLNPSD